MSDPSPWVPTQDPLELKVLGKALEEAGEVTNALGRCIVQGIDGFDPKSGKANRRWLEEEIADAMCTLSIVVQIFKLDERFIANRVQTKADYLGRWLEMPV